MDDRSTIWVSTTGSSATRKGIPPTELRVEVLGENINLFLSQLNQVLEKTPDTVAKFQLTEFEVHAEVSGKGQVILMGAGGEIGATGGLKFVFKKVELPQKK